jgi:hypothetical protein
MTQTAGPGLPSRAWGRSGVNAPLLGPDCWGIAGPDENLGPPMGWPTALGEGDVVLVSKVGYFAGTAKHG